MSLADDFQLSISDGVARYFRNQAIRLRRASQPIRITRNGQDAGCFFFNCSAQFDEEQDYLIKHCEATFVVSKNLGDQIRGWQFIGQESLYSDFEFYNLPPGVVSTASAPGLLTLDRDLVLALEPDLAGFRGLRLLREDRRRRTSRYLGSFDTIADHLWRGDSRAAMVLAIKPRVLVAAYSDDFDAILVLEFPKSFATKFELQPGTRLLTCNTFSQTEESIAADIAPGSSCHTPFTDFHPLIGQFLSGDSDRMEHRMANIPPSEWNRVRQLGEEWLVRFGNGHAQPRPGVALWPTGLIGKMRRWKGSLGRRVLATTFDLSLLTTICFLLWFLLGLGDEITVFWQNPKNPVARAAFVEHKDTFRNVSTLVYFSYATLMLLIPWQATLGKRLLGLRVVSRESFGRISFLNALRRSALSLLSGACGALGFLSMLWSRSGQTWHDDRTGTCVIHDRTRNWTSDRGIALGMVVSIVLMGFSVIWKLQTAVVIAPVVPPNADPLVGHPAMDPFMQLPRILPSEGELLIEAVAFPELNLELSPPREFRPATEYVGFQHESTQSTIKLSTKPANFAEVMEEYSFDRLRKAGATFRGSRSRMVFGRSTGEVQFEQPTPNGLFVNWVFVLDADDGCVIALASAPKNREVELTPFLKASIATLRWLPKPQRVNK